MIEKYFIKGISCPACAIKIEDRLNSLSYVKHASISTSTDTLSINTSNIESVKKAIKEIDPKVTISKVKQDNEQSFNIKRNIFFLCGMIVAFIASMITIHYTNNIVIENISILVLILIYAISGRDVIKAALRSMKDYDFFNENSLMSVATIAAFIIGAYGEAVAVMLFFRTGEFFQELALNNSKRSIKSLLEITPNITHLKKDSKIIDISPHKLAIDDIIIVKSGEKIPIDGIVINGESSVDTKTLTGESIPKSVKIGSQVLGGMVNLNGALEIKVTKYYKDTSIAKIIDMIENASSNKSKAEKFTTLFARVYTPIVFILALCVMVIPPLLGFGDFITWIKRALVMLVVSCPCALVISIPLAYFGGIGSASKNHILMKGANYLEALGNVDNIAFDKTGTLTKGVFKVIKIETRNGFSKEEVLQYACCAENLSSHPIANAIKEEYSKLNIQHKCNNLKFETINGAGIKASCNFENIIVGSDKILHMYDIEHSTCSVNGSVAHVAVNNKYAGYILIADELKSDTKEAIEELRHLGVKKMVMLTGDNEFASNNIAKILKLDDIKYNLMPEDKVKYFEALKKSSNKSSIFVGDGINDAPSIALADVGISMGKLGSDVSKESADVLIINDSIKSIAKAIRIAKKTKIIIWQNIIFAIGVKMLFMILGVFGVANMWEAVFGDVGVALIALFNSMRILKI